jgi:hypothetical protein
MENYEKLGVFYLGREYDLAKKAIQDNLLLYDSKDLVTHAVCVGMTGSGKTGLCLSLIEEAMIDGIPAILIDPKGDLTNLLLTFPNLSADDFLPYVNLDDARQKGLSPEEFAARQASLWKKGLADWQQDGSRIQRLKDAADIQIYTPGSNIGIPVSILKSFAVPEAEIMEDRDLFRDRVSTVVISLLGLVGIQADPVQSREFILLSTLIETAWRKGDDLDLATLIQQVQTPPVTRIGVLDLEAFYPAKDRFSLMLALNNLLASPGFSAWMEGAPLDVGSFLYDSSGKPQVAIFSISHLSDPERMFFVSLLLNQVLGWMRTQSGTTSLRAIVYMDEVFGFLPPIGNPPSKVPLLTLLKQARAFGVGIMLATQNPVDLDYKALSNAGTWFVGRLQTERDKNRLLDGLEGVATATGTQFNRREIDKMISSLGSRVFLMNNTHEDAPVIFHTRWAMSYLRGPLTRDQIKRLMSSYVKPAAAAPARRPAQRMAPSSAAVVPPQEEVVEAPLPAAKAAGQMPTLPPGITQFYVPLRQRLASSKAVVYQPRLLGVAKINFVDTKNKINLSKTETFVTPVLDEAIPVNWDDADLINISVNDLEKTAERGAKFADLPPAAAQVKNYTAWNRDFVNWLYAAQSLELFYSPAFKVMSKLDESERDFRIRLETLAREQRDEKVEALRKKYAPKLLTLQDRIRRAQQAVQREKDQAKEQGFQAAISLGATILSAFTGRKATSASTLGKAATTVRGVSRTMTASQDIGRAGESVEALQAQAKALQAEFDQETADLESKLDALAENLDTIIIKPKKTDITVQLLSFTWIPFSQDSTGSITAAW